MSDLDAFHAALGAYSDLTRDLRPVPARLEVGALTLQALRAECLPPPDWIPPGARIGLPCGIPIVEDTELHPHGWRLLDGDGNVMRSYPLSDAAEEEP